MKIIGKPFLAEQCGRQTKTKLIRDNALADQQMHPSDQTPRLHSIPLHLKDVLHDVAWMKDVRHEARKCYLAKELYSELAEHWHLVLYPFESETPQRFFSEDAFHDSIDSLWAAFRQERPKLENAFTKLSFGLDSAFSNYDYITSAIQTQPLNDMDRESRFRHVILPRYLQLFEGVWRPLMRLCYFATQPLMTIDPEAIENLDYAGLKRDLENSLPSLFRGCDSFLRNAVAHQRFVFSEDLAKADLVTCMNYHHREKDKQKRFITRDYDDQEIEALVDTLYDTCSGIQYAILCLLAFSEKSATPIPLSFYYRKQVYSQALSDRGIALLGTSHFEKEGMQRNVQIKYDRRPNLRALHFGLRALKLTMIVYPSVSYFLSIGPSEKRFYFWIITKHEQAEAYFQNKLPFMDYLNSGDFQFLIPSRNLFRKPVIHSLIRNFPQMVRMIPFIIRHERQKRRGWKIFFKSESGIYSRRFLEIKIVLLRAMERTEVRETITNLRRRNHPAFKDLFSSLLNVAISYLNLKVRPRRLTHSIRISVWKKEKRPSRMVVIPDEVNPLCVCAAEWSLGDTIPWPPIREGDEIIGRLRIQWY